MKHWTTVALSLWAHLGYVMVCPPFLPECVGGECSTVLLEMFASALLGAGMALLLD